MVVPLIVVGSVIAWSVAGGSARRRGRISSVVRCLMIFLELACNSVYMLCAVPADGSVVAAVAFAVVWSLVLPVTVLRLRRQRS
jgi:hypothetical protein